jgi:small subunit ribosomal protein S6
MRAYEAMCIVRPDLSEEEKKNLFRQIGELIAKNKGAVTQAAVWAERRRLGFLVKKFSEGTYYLVNFTAPQEAIPKMRYDFRLNEQVLRIMITNPALV